MDPQKRAALGILACLFLAAISSILVPTPTMTASPGGSPWRGRAMLLVEASREGGEVLKALATLGYRRVISDETEPVEVSSLGLRNGRPGLETLGLAEARRRLGPGDPRWDEYLESLGAWFSAEVQGHLYKVYYVEGRFGQAEELRLRNLLGGDPGSVLTPPGGPRGASFPYLPLVALVLLGLLILPARGSDRLVLLGLLLPLGPLLLGGLPGGLSALLLGLGLTAMAKSLRLGYEDLLDRRRLVTALRLVMSGLGSLEASLLLPAFGVLILEPQALPATVLSLAAALAGGFGVTALWRALGHRGRFVPVPLLAGRVRSSREARSPAGKLPGLGLFLLLLGLAVSLFPGSGVGPSSPLLGTATLPWADPGSQANQPGPEAAKAHLAAPGALPGLSDWLAHRWRQETLFYRVLAEAAAPFSPVSLPLAGSEGPPATKADTAWARGAYRALPRDSLEALWAQGPRLYVARRGPPGIAKGVPLAPMEVILYIILMVPPILALLRRRLGRVPQAPGAIRTE